MKIERLIGIIFYLSNRERVTANQLAEHFEVSRRTIFRDIDTLTLAGIPIYSDPGVKGGYTLNKEFRVNDRLLDEDNSEYIILALQSLKSIYGNTKIDETYEKTKHIYASTEVSHPNIDLSVIGENKKTIETVHSLQDAIRHKQTISFLYTNAQGIRKNYIVHGLKVYYQWYAWYFFAYDLDKDDSRVFKVVRMDTLTVSDKSHTTSYPIEKLHQKYLSDHHKDRETIVIQYPPDLDILIDEYFKGHVDQVSHEYYERTLKIKKSDFVSFSLLLGFGDRIKIITPEDFKSRYINHLNKVLQNNI